MGQSGPNFDTSSATSCTGFSVEALSDIQEPSQKGQWYNPRSAVELHVFSTLLLIVKVLSLATFYFNFHFHLKIDADPS